MAIEVEWMQAQSLAFFASWTPLMLLAVRAAVLGREPVHTPDISSNETDDR